MRINAADLNNTRKLSFDAIVVSGVVFDQTTGAIDCSACTRDFAPGVGLYSYQVKIGKPSLVVKSLKPTPAKPTAGKPFTLRLVAARSDNGAVVQNGRATCVGRIGSAKIPASTQRVVGRGDGVHLEHPRRTPRGRRSGGRCRSRSKGSRPRRATPGRFVSPALVRPVALLAPLLAAVVVTGAAAGSIGQTPRSVVARAQQKVHPAPDPSSFRPDGQNRVRVIMTLHDPPLAAATYARRSGIATRSKLDFRSSFARSYLSTLAEEQDAAIARLHREIPQARVSRRYQVVENGFAVSVPYARLPELLSSGIATRVYPSLAYRLDLNRGPAIIGAPQFSAATGAKGDGVKVAVVDDGVDQQHPFFDPKGFSYPPGFPKGDTGSTTPKVIVARAFAGPNSNGAVLDRDQSFHGTFVAGVIAGVGPTDVPAGRPGFCIRAEGGCHPAVSGISGVAPRAWIGNYRVFNVPNPAPLGGCCSANSPEIVAAFEAAVKDGMDVINFSGGGPQADPRTDILIDAVKNVVKAGVVPVISAGQRPRLLRARHGRARPRPPPTR